MRKEVKGYEGKYTVDEDGNVYSVARDIKLKTRVNETSGGYVQVMLWKNSKAKNCYLHRVVAEAFIDNPNNYKQVRHIDGDYTNNNVNNLEWFNKFTKMYNDGKESE